MTAKEVIATFCPDEGYVNGSEFADLLISALADSGFIIRTELEMSAQEEKLRAGQKPEFDGDVNGMSNLPADAEEEICLRTGAEIEAERRASKQKIKPTT